MNESGFRSDMPSEEIGTHIDIESVAGAQIGDNNTQYNYFGGSRGQVASAVVTPIMPTYEAAPSVFVGRTDEVARLLGLLNPIELPTSTVVISAVAGLAGIGKTALAQQAAAAAVSNGWFLGGAAMVDLHGYDPQRRIDQLKSLALCCGQLVLTLPEFRQSRISKPQRITRFFQAWRNKVGQYY
jgi:hypothetical protein